MTKSKPRQAGTVKLSTLTLNPRNPRSITEAAFAKLCDSIKRDPQFMELRPIVVDKDGLILGGNMRARACEKLGMEAVPASWVRRADNLTPAQRKRFILVDNAPDGMSGVFDDELLANDFDIADLDALGFDMSDVTGGEDPMPDAQGKASVVCPKCQWEFEP